MDVSKTLKVDGPVQEEPRLDERLQAVLHAELADFFMYYDVLNFRLRWLLSQYEFKDFADLRTYYYAYVLPRINEQKNEDNKKVSE